MASQEHSEHTHYTESGASHIAHPRVYFITWIALLVLMVATVVAAQFDFGKLNNFIAMGIAITKASLVVMFFMQVKGSSKLTILWAAIGFVWLAFLFSIIGDYLSRGWLPVSCW
jgi:cytochrome c oxidase subunit 4